MNELLELVPAGVPIAVFLDYDGTLVPIRKRPELARLDPERRAALARLGRKTVVGVVSGRPLAELRRLVAVPGLAYAGNHGLEIRINGRTWVHPEALRQARTVARTVSAIETRLGGIPGVLVEGKGLTASVHYRLAAPADRRRVRAAVSDEVRRGGRGLVCRPGKMVLEIRPDIPWDKGQAILELMRLAFRSSRCFPIYIGDDRTDEDAFRVLAGWGLAVHVGMKTLTIAPNRLPGVGAVWRFLEDLRSRFRSGNKAMAFRRP